MLGLFLFVALVAALAATGYRVVRRLRRRRALAALAGGSPETAFEIEAFSEIEDHLAHRECPCGGLLESLGERTVRDVRFPREKVASIDRRTQREKDAHLPAGKDPRVRHAKVTSIRPEHDVRILRVVRVECLRCEERGEVWFDATRAYQ